LRKAAQLALSPDKSEMRTIDERGGGRFVDVHQRSFRFANLSQYNVRQLRIALQRTMISAIASKIHAAALAKRSAAIIVMPNK
jgi:hypothetical protein